MLYPGLGRDKSHRTLWRAMHALIRTGTVRAARAIGHGTPQRRVPERLEVPLGSRAPGVSGCGYPANGQQGQLRRG